MESLNKKTYAQQLILAKIAEKKEQEITNQSWEEYEEFYNDYSDSHSDYYDAAEGELAFIEKIKQEKMLINDAKKNNKIKNMIQKIMNYVKIKTKIKTK